METRVRSHQHVDYVEIHEGEGIGIDRCLVLNPGALQELGKWDLEGAASEVEEIW